MKGDQEWMELLPSIIDENELPTLLQKTYKLKQKNKLLWPYSAKRAQKKPTAQQMIKAGFCYMPLTSSYDHVVCPYCEVELDGWEVDDDAVEEHLKRNSNCGFFEDKEPNTTNKTKKEVKDPKVLRKRKDDLMTGRISVKENDQKRSVPEESAKPRAKRVKKQEIQPKTRSRRAVKEADDEIITEIKTRGKAKKKTPVVVLESTTLEPKIDQETKNKPEPEVVQETKKKPSTRRKVATKKPAAPKRGRTRAATVVVLINSENQSQTYIYS